MFNPMFPDRDMFAKDPGGYSRSAWMRWAMLASAHGASLDPSKSPTSEDLKHPILWLAQAEAMAQAAIVLVKNEPAFDRLPVEVRGICDAQYCAVALMMVGYSLEVCLKAMILLREGVESYSETEQTYRNHELPKLANFVNGLGSKDLAILELLTHFVYWAGRYPDPGRKHINKHDKIFELSEDHRVTLPDITELAARVMRHVRTLVDGA